MKYVFITIMLFTMFAETSAQVVSGVRPSQDGKLGEFTEWQQAVAVFDDQSTANIEYRIALAARKGIGCHYDVEIKNLSDTKITIRLKSSYYDKLVKGQFGDEIKESLKPGKSVVGRFVAQGCKKEKDAPKDDYQNCISCDFGVSIFVSK
jgi:hypothetical protein